MGVKQKVMIVFEETEGIGLDSKGTAGNRFNVYLEGDIEKLKVPGKINEDELSSAEFWGLKMFQIVAHHLQQSGAVEDVKRKGFN